MKKILLFTAILFASITMVTGQATSARASDQVTLAVRLYPIQTIVVNSAQKDINLDYKLTTDYRNGVESSQENHLTVFSTGGFIVKARSSDAFIANKTNSKSIESSTLTITASKGSNSSMSANYGVVSLNNVDGDNLISSDFGGAHRNFNITYAGMGNYEFMNSYVKSESPTVYRTTVTYTITPN